MIDDDDARVHFINIRFFGISFDLHLFYYRIGLFQNQLFGLGNDFKLTRMIQSSNYVLSLLHRRLDPSLNFSLHE